MKNQNKISSFVIGAGFPLAQFTLLLYTPTLPFLAHYFGISIKMMLFGVSFQLFGYMVGNLMWGTLSDLLGRQRTVLVGLILYLITALYIFTTKTFTPFCIGLTILGIICATFPTVGNALLRDIYGKEKSAKVIAYIGITMASSPMVAPLIGAQLLHQFNWQSIFLFLFAYAAILLILAIKYLPETKHEQSHQTLPLISAFRLHLGNSIFLRHTISLALCFGLSMVLLSTLAFVYIRYLHLSLATYSVLSLLVIAPYPCVSIIGSWVVKPTNTKKLARIGVSISLLGALVLLALSLKHNHSIVLTTIAIMLGFGGLGFTAPMNKAGAMTSVHQNSGSAASIMKFIQALGGTILTSINASFHQLHSLENMSIILAVAMIVAFI